jgi:large subunit ribosomal protein L6
VYEKTVNIPEKIKLEIEGRIIKVEGPMGVAEKKITVTKDVNIEKVDNKVRVFSESETKKIKAMVGSIVSHINNMITGVTTGFTYRLKVVFSHFPITVKVEGSEVLIQNFLGERTPRIAKIVGKSEVKVAGSDIIVTGIDLEDVGQTASNIEQAARIVGYDRRRFMDGIYLVGKE